MKASQLQPILKPGDRVTWTASGLRCGSGVSYSHEFDHMSKDGMLVAFPFASRHTSVRIKAAEVTAVDRYCDTGWFSIPLA